jgi:GNAT superfamily N-acetyltransferase
VGVEVRIVDEADVPALAVLRRTWNEEQQGASITDDEFVDSFAAWWRAERPTRTFFLVEVDGAPVGMANVKRYERMPVAGRPTGGAWGYVGNVFVLSQHRNLGVGRVLMEAVQAWAWSQGFEHLRLAPSSASATFYARLGYAPGAVVEANPPR